MKQVVQIAAADPWQILVQSVETEWERLVALAPRLGVAVLVFLFFLLLGRWVGLATERLLRRTGRAKRYESVARRLVSLVLGALGLVLALHVLGLTALATSLLATGGLAAVVLGFAFKDIGENLLAGLLLAFSRSFEVGDLIASQGIEGIVRDIELRHVHVRTADGCDIYIPSAQIFRNPLYNYTRDGLRRGRFVVGLDYRDDIAKARSLLLEEVLTIPGVLPDPPPKVYQAGFSANTVDLEVFFWINTFSKGPTLLRVRTNAMEAARRTLASAGFTFSSEVTTGLSVPPLDVRLGPEGPGPDPSTE